jgi:tRNA dimethylallyltransferase
VEWTIETASLIRVPALLGPTAAGKTALAVDIACQRGWEIISCDSRQVYRGMNIGTAKPDTAALSRVRHHLIDMLEPDVSWSAFDFARDARRTIRDLAAQSKTGFICGGTGLYFESLRRGIAPQTPSDRDLRERLQKRAQQEGSETLYAELREKDPETAQKIHTNDEQRILRALSVFYATGRPVSELRRRTEPPRDMLFRVAVVVPPRDLLYERINRRVDEMAAGGMYDEFLRLCERGFDENSPGLHCIGYRELFAVRRNECSLHEALDRIKKNTRNYAKRQCSWFAAHNRSEIVSWSDKPATVRENILKQIDDSPLVFGKK